MSENDDSVRGSSVRELAEYEAFQSSVARAFFSSNPVAERGGFGVHDVEEALLTGSKDDLHALAGALKFSDVDSKATKIALVKMIRRRGVKLGAFVRDADDTLVFAATVQVDAPSSAEDVQDVDGHLQASGSTLGAADLALATDLAPPSTDLVRSPPSTPGSSSSWSF